MGRQPIQEKIHSCRNYDPTRGGIEQVKSDAMYPMLCDLNLCAVTGNHASSGNLGTARPICGEGA